MSRLAGRLGCGTRAGSRECGLGWTLGRAGLLGRSRSDDWLLPVLREEAGEISHLLLQGGNLGLQGVKPLGQRSEEHTSELQSHLNLVCRLLLEKKKQYVKL